LRILLGARVRPVAGLEACLNESNGRDSAEQYQSGFDLPKRPVVRALAPHYA
jgi:hypothetical protein